MENKAAIYQKIEKLTWLPHSLLLQHGCGSWWCNFPCLLCSERTPRSSGNPTKSSTGGPNYIWLILCACFLAMACCFGFLCLAFRQRKSPKKRAVEVESSDEERPVLAAAPAPPVASVAPPAAVPLIAPQAPPPVTYYRVKPRSARPPLLEPSEPVADRA